MEENLKKVEAVLFSIGKKVDIEELSKLTDITNLDDLKSILYQLQEHYEKSDSSLMLMEDGSSWKLTVREKFMHLVHNIVTETELSKTIMETLAVIAWKYPILQSDVIKIRTNKAYDHLKELEESGFISRTKYGRTNKIKLSDKFFTYFDLPHDRQKAQEKFEELIPERIKRKLEKLQRDIIDNENELINKKEKIKQYEDIRKKEKDDQDKIDKGDIGLDDDKENNDEKMSDEDKEKLEMETGEKDEDLETEEGREAQIDDDEISPAEEGFMQGEEQATNLEKESDEEAIEDEDINNKEDNEKKEVTEDKEENKKEDEKKEVKKEVNIK